MRIKPFWAKLVIGIFFLLLLPPLQYFEICFGAEGHFTVTFVRSCEAHKGFSVPCRDVTMSYLGDVEQRLTPVVESSLNSFPTMFGQEIIDQVSASPVHLFGEHSCNPGAKSLGSTVLLL